MFYLGKSNSDVKGYQDKGIQHRKTPNKILLQIFWEKCWGILWGIYSCEFNYINVKLYLIMCYYSCNFVHKFTVMIKSILKVMDYTYLQLWERAIQRFDYRVF